MRKSIIATLAVCMFTAAPLLAGDLAPSQHIEGAPGSHVEGTPGAQHMEGAPGSQVEGAPGSTVMSPDQKNECLLYSKKCMDSVDSIQTKMRKLDNEIKKGTRVYTPEELKRLEEKLKDLDTLMDRMLENP
jgi:hypothetical protein